MAGFDPQILDTREVQYQCDCSEERTKNMLLSLGRKELEKLRDEDPRCEVVCHFCHTKYEFDLNELLAETAGREINASKIHIIEQFAFLMYKQDLRTAYRIVGAEVLWAVRYFYLQMFATMV